MHTFPSPEPIELRVRLGAGDVAVEAAPRTETDVEVQPSDPGSRVDVEHAEATRVDHREGIVTVTAPDEGRSWRVGRSPAIVVRVGLPEGSTIRVDSSSADVVGRGRLGPAEVKTASGDVEIEQAADVKVETASGDIIVRRADGEARIGTASGDVMLQHVTGDAEVTSASGDILVGRADGELRLKTASGDATVDTAEGSVTAKTASGDARVRQAHRGALSFDTASGDVRIGIAEGTAAWLDVQSLSGQVSSALAEADAPDEDGDTVRVRARTLSGDIAITRAT